jgi:glycosyltransferase involved in cell wall biosynthesis
MLASLATILPSNQEGLARCVMESMALGIPVIGTDARGVRDLLDECGGLKVPVGDPTALKDAMMRFIRDPEMARQIGEESRSRMAQFDISRLIEMHEHLYAELLPQV